MIRHQIERDERIEALKTRYLRDEITEAVFCASLRGVGGMTSEDIRHELGNYAPPAPKQTFEERRMEISHRWIREFLNRG